MSLHGVRGDDGDRGGPDDDRGGPDDDRGGPDDDRGGPDDDHDGLGGDEVRLLAGCCTWHRMLLRCRTCERRVKWMNGRDKPKLFFQSFAHSFIYLFFGSKFLLTSLIHSSN